MTATVTAPALVAYDGSPEAQAAVREAAALLIGRTLLITTVWEAGLGALPVSVPLDVGVAYASADPAEILAVDEAVEGHATDVADEGVRLAREAGATAEAVAVADALDPAETLAEIADDRDAAVIVVGSRGLRGLKGRLHGSTTQKLMHRTRRPLLVIRLDD